MSGALQIGPLSVPFELLLVFAAVGSGSLVGSRLGRKLGVDADPALFRLLLVALIASRLSFVLRFHEAYSAAPLGILDIRDGGWSPLGGIVAAWACLLVLAWLRRTLARPVGAALATATGGWLLGTMILATWPAEALQIPVVKLASPQGQEVLLSEFHGKPVVVNLWATWCPPCQRELPILEQAQTERPDVHFVFLNQGEAAETVNSFLVARYPGLRNVLLDIEGSVSASFGQRALPTTLFFDAHGKLVSTRIGELSRATLAQRLDALP
ncbi:Thiol-disulfide isomerase or thioredoxin [Variovorax sp. HW608]|uniref:TlpA disulfide reductase family protein n=1 Tax=Variovorax sp. HW608 TaxID=1034889 RepID=UPI0008201E5E|nr:TlpA disulfide reductase family protein [Variovorax sp. HW608]SCK27560.1 Thiol-disulfide isomerase or thioredoxin [Variovorax sp. HW608]